MTRRVKRSKDFELSLTIKGDDFIRAPRESQRNWILNRAMKEFADELVHLDKVAGTLIKGVDGDGLSDRTQTPLRDEDIMEDWQIPVMQEMANVVCDSHGDVLEIGFGRGVASTFIQEAGAKSHTVIECNDSVVERYETWRRTYPDRDIRLLHGRWQDVVDQLGTYDGIFFHTYPLNEQEFVEQVVQSDTFAEHFFTVAAKQLRNGGVFSYLTSEIDSLSRGHQRRLLEHFSSFTLSLLRDLDVPDDTRDALWSDSMVMIKVIK